MKDSPKWSCQHFCCDNKEVKTKISWCHCHGSCQGANSWPQAPREARAPGMWEHILRITPGAAQLSLQPKVMISVVWEIKAGALGTSPHVETHIEWLTKPDWEGRTDCFWQGFSALSHYLPKEPCQISLPHWLSPQKLSTRWTVSCTATPQRATGDRL